MRPRLICALALLLLLGGSGLAAQTGGLELTAFAGPNYSWQSGSARAGSDGQLGVSIGLHLHQPIAGRWSADPEIGFAYKGANDNGGTASAGETVVSVRLWYLQLPIPIRYAVVDNGHVRARLYLGPYISIRAGCTAELESPTAVASQSCSDLPSLSDTTQVFDPYKTWDTGIVGGLGMSAPLFGIRFDFDLRYEHGMLNISRLSGTVYNRTVMFAVGVPF
jgi:hypothetical protein